MNIRFTPEISAGHIITALSAIGVVLVFWKDVSVDIALLKQGQMSAQIESNRLRGEIREVREDVKDLGRAIARPGERARGG